MWPFSAPYISAQGAERIKNYKYSGEDRSLIYKHVLTPMNNFLLELIPRWVAPNLITLLGLLFTMLSHVVMAYYSPNFDSDLPAWVCILNGVCLFAYQTLDNLDGKQARRTGSSSPLGLVFDHGIDSLNVMVAGLSMCCICQTGPTWKAFLATVQAMWLFYLNTFEEFYTGSLILPIINGPTEGLLINMCISFFTAYAGKQFWHNSIYIPLSLAAANRFDFWFDWLPGWESLRTEVEAQGGIQLHYNTMLLLLVLIPSALTLVLNMWNVYSSINSGASNKKEANSKFAHALSRLGVFWSLCLMFSAWLFFSPSGVFVRHPRIFLWTMEFLFSKLVIHLMLAHMCDEEYHPFRRTTVPFFFCACHAAISIAANSFRDVDETLLLVELFAVSAVSFMHMVIGVVSELCAVLNISCFRIKPKSS